MDDDDDDGDDHQGRESPPPVSRLGRGGPRRNRVLRRANDRYRNRDRFRLQLRPLRIEELIGVLLKHHGLTDEARQRSVCLYWPEIAGERIAPKTWPISFSEGVLRVSVVSSSWVHEMQFFKATLVAQINNWIDENRVWLGPAPLVTDMRFVLKGRAQDPLVDREHATRLRLRQVRRLMQPSEAPRLSAMASGHGEPTPGGSLESAATDVGPSSATAGGTFNRSSPRDTNPGNASLTPVVSDSEREAIRAETNRIIDAELRAVIEALRLKWNR